MCGRFTVAFSLDELNRILQNDFQINQMFTQIAIPRYNVAPEQDLISIIHDGMNFRVGTLKWGLIGTYLKQTKQMKWINTRSETIDESVVFRDSYHHRRCMILADGFYEWDKSKKPSQPYYFHLKGNEPFAFLGIYQKTLDENEKPVFRCSILTKAADESIEDIHDRMPIILRVSEAKKWVMKQSISLEESRILFRGVSAKDIERYPVSQIVNQVKTDQIECIEPIHL